MSRRFREWNLDCKIYIGNLSEQASKHDLESALMKYGHLKNVWVARNPPGFAFVEFEDARDAEDAVRALDGSRICGSRIRVEKSHGRSKRNPQPRGRGFGGGRDNGRYYPSGGNRRSRSRERHESYNRSRGRSRSRTRSPPARRGRYSRSRSRSPSDRHSLPPSPRSPRSPPPRSPISPRRSPMNGKSPHSRGDSRSRSRSITPNRD